MARSDAFERPIPTMYSVEEVSTITTPSTSAWFGIASLEFFTHRTRVLSALTTFTGGGINGHSGNVQFREWVKVRKNDYNLASSKVEKARVAQEVIALVRQQDPPGRFLQKDPSSGVGGQWWVELDEERVVAKTSQALREGAPQIRAAAQQRDIRFGGKTRLGRKNGANGSTRGATTTTPSKTVFTSVPASLKRRMEYIAPAPRPIAASDEIAYQEKAIMELRSNVEEARLRNDMLENDPIIQEEKRLRLDDGWGKATPAPASLGTSLPPRQAFSSEQRQNSLALSEFSFDPGMDDFVNPFSDEVETTLPTSAPKALNKVPNTVSVMTPPSETPRPLDKMMRLNSTASNGDLGGLKSLTAPPPVPARDSFSRQKSVQSAATQVSKLDWEEGDPLLNYLTSLDRGVTAQ